MSRSSVRIRPLAYETNPAAERLAGFCRSGDWRGRKTGGDPHGDPPGTLIGSLAGVLEGIADLVGNEVGEAVTNEAAKFHVPWATTLIAPGLERSDGDPVPLRDLAFVQQRRALLSKPNILLAKLAPVQRSYRDQGCDSAPIRTGDGPVQLSEKGNALFQGLVPVVRACHGAASCPPMEMTGPPGDDLRFVEVVRMIIPEPHRARVGGSLDRLGLNQPWLFTSAECRAKNAGMANDLTIIHPESDVERNRYALTLGIARIDARVRQGGPHQRHVQPESVPVAIGISSAKGVPTIVTVTPKSCS